MKKFLAGALVGVLIVLGLQDYDQVKTQKLNAEGWETVCTFIDNYEYNCEGLIAPYIVEFPNEGNEGYHGWYDGGSAIFVNESLEGIDRASTIFHEMIHYIHKQQGLVEIPGPAEQVCWSENEAFKLEDIWLTALGYPELARPDWWVGYSHCWPYYGTPEYQQFYLLFELLLGEVIIIFEE